MDLKKRLANLDKLSSKKRRSTKQTLPDDCPESDCGSRISTHDSRLLLEDLGLSEQQYGKNTVWTCEFPPVAGVPAPVGFPDLSAMFTQPAPADLCPEELLFLDTETTGLAGGTGTFAFLIGLAWWTGDGFVVLQLFLPGPGQETPMLRVLSAVAERFRVVVTFNGNGFDLPLLRTRALMSRLPASLAHLVSWDLLPAVRRLWRKRLDNCRQQTIETRICGQKRGHWDIDGALIPQTYFQYLREGKTGLLKNVLTHNQRDMVGMGEILNAVISAAEAISMCSPEPPESSAEAKPQIDENLPWQDAWSRGRICEARRDRRAAAFWLEQAVLISPLDSAQTEIPERFFADSIRILKRVAHWRLVEQLIESGLIRWPECDWLSREAAILYEHRLGQLHRAYEHARTLGEPGRIARLERKLAKR